MKNWKTGLALMVSCVMLASCGGGNNDDDGGEGGTCSFSGARCSADNSSVETCVSGKTHTESCGGAGCSGGVCNSGEQCSFTGARCSADNSAVETCVSGQFHSESCGEVGCNAGVCNKTQTGNTCNYSGSKCSTDGKNLLSCNGGQESSQPCPFDCAYNKCKDKPSEGNVDTDLPKVIGLDPVSGKAGTKVTIKGANLADVKKAFFAGSEVSVESASADAVVAIAPDDLEGSVNVGVIVNGERLSAGLFTYLKESENTAEVDWCQLMYVEPTGKPGETLKAYAQVYEEGITGQSGIHNGLKGQVGYMKDATSPSDTAAYTWVDAHWNEAFSGEAASSNDEFMSDDVVLGTGKYYVAYRFSLDGTNWKYCDGNGSQDGFSGDQAATVVVAEEPVPEPPKVTWCRIMNGNKSIVSEAGVESEMIYAQGYVPDCTDYQNHCAKLKAQVGFGSPALSTTEAVDEGYTWSDAVINTGYDGTGGTKHDEFMGSVKADAVGTYSIVYRMSVDDGENWTYCDTSDDVIFSVADAMTLSVVEKGSGEVEPPTPEKKIEFCRVQSPDALKVKVNQESAVVYGQVYVPGCTGGSEACEGMQAQVMYGDPSGAVESFTPVDAVYNSLADAGNNDEFYAKLTPTAAGDYAVVYRFSLDGENWTYCDYDNEDGFTMDKAIPMNVYDKDTIVWCRTILDKGEVYKGSSLNAYGQVWVDNCSEGDKKCASVIAQVGYGAEGTDAEDFTYSDATFNDAVTTGNNDEYMAELTPGALGATRVAYRFSVDNKASWTYCDADDAAEFTAENMASVKVKDPIEWCQMYMNSPISVAKLDVATDKIYGQVFVADCSASDKDAACTGLKAEIGYGTGDDVSAFTFVDADYEKDVGYNDEFSKALTFDTVGEYKIVYAFSQADGARKYCSLNGSKPFDLEDAGVVKVIDPATHVPEIEWCRIVSEVPADMTVGSEYKIYGQAYVGEDNCTQPEGACEGLMAYIGYGASTDNMDDFNFVSATYFKDVGNNDEFVATLKPEAEGSYKVVYAFSMDGGKTKTYCTGDNESPKDLSKAASVTVTKPAAPKVGWCRVQYPENVAAKQGETSDIVYGQVYVSGCTEGELKCNAVMAEAGYGTGEDLDAYTWVSAIYNELATSTNNDEYGVAFNIGRDVVDMTYNVVYRFSLDNGETWTYCDFDDAEGFDIAKTAKMKVEAGDPIMGEPFVRGTDFSCGIDKSFANINTVIPGDTTIYGQIWMPGCTDSGKCNKIVGAHLHYISSGSASTEDIRTSSVWKSVDASYNGEYTGASNDEYMTAVEVDSAGDYAFAYSFDLKHDPSDALEKAQRVFCFVDWQEFGYGTMNVQYVGP